MDNKNVPQAGTPIQPLGQNPLQKHFRQPKIYLKLPSQGRWYPNGATVSYTHLRAHET
mgnify:CR=1 FL=1